MPQVNVEELEKAAKKKKDSINTIETKKVGDTLLFKGPYVDKWFDDRDECARENESFARKEQYKKEGLDEFGRTKSQVLLQAKKKELIFKREEILAKAKQIDKEIASLKESDFEGVKESKKK